MSSLFTNISMLAVLAVLVFLLIKPPVLPHTHEDHASNFGDYCQADPCHISIYHYGQGKSCDHKFHFTSGEEDCPLCHLVPVRQITPDLYSLKTWLAEKADRNFISISMQEWMRYIVHSDRGPPAFS